MTPDQRSQENTPELAEFIQQLVDSGAGIVALEKDVPVAAEEQGIVLRVTPQTFNQNYPGLTWVQCEGRGLLIECTIDNYGVPLGEDQGLVDLLPVYVSEEAGEPVAIEEGLKSIRAYLGGDGA